MKPASRGTVRVFPDKGALDAFMLDEWSALCRNALDHRGRFMVALSGGRTPISFYARLSFSGRDLPWEQTHIFLADERCVPLDHPDSNYRLIEINLIRHVPIPPENVHRVPVELEPREAAAGYEKEIRSFFGLEDRQFPELDLVLLGIGEDGHTASLFPDDAAITETRRLAVAVAREAPDHPRVSLTLPVIDRATSVVFLVSGLNKAPVLKAVLKGGSGLLPAALVRARSGPALFLADSDAATLLSPPPATNWSAK
jgi:6-phosphogluconolactonase